MSSAGVSLSSLYCIKQTTVLPLKRYDMHWEKVRVNSVLIILWRQKSIILMLSIDENLLLVPTNEGLWPLMLSLSKNLSSFTLRETLRIHLVFSPKGSVCNSLCLIWKKNLHKFSVDTCAVWAATDLRIWLMRGSLIGLALVIIYYYSNFIHCTNSDFLIGWFVPRDTELWRNNRVDVIIVV